MNDDLVGVKLEPREWRLVSTLRDIPGSPLRDLVFELAGELATYAAQPQCTEVQADGVPCDSAASDCERCEKVKELLSSLRRRTAGL
jgi:hypothetical protein